MGPWQAECTDADERAALTELMPRWDELSADALREIERDPTHGPGLRLLRRTDEWLQSRCAPASACPSAEELYDYGQGPGPMALSEARRRDIESHVAECAECEALTATLEMTPPLPLDLEAGDIRAAVDSLRPTLSRTADPEPQATAASAALAPSPAPPEGRLLTHPRWRRNLRRVAPAAAAAALLALALIVSHESSPTLAGGALPEAAQLRGNTNGPLMFPRGQVLAGCRFDRGPRFEVTEQAQASEYRIVLRQHDGDAFSQGKEILRADSPDPVIRASLAIAPGHYTWEAWAVVDGLDRSLGSRDFDVVQNVELLARADSASGAERVRILHDAGFTTDARLIAWTLPDSEFREEYLRLLPGR